MLLIYSLKTTQRITYIFKHICFRFLVIEVNFTNVIEDFMAYSGPKLSYGKKKLGDELFIQSTELLMQDGFESIDITVKDWGETKCFFAVGKNSSLPFDIFAASFYLLSRYEEYLPQVKDEKGRFLASESIAFKAGFLQDPVVDIWAYKFKDLLLQTFPDIKYSTRKPCVHNIINASQPLLYKNKGLLRTLIGFFNDLFNFNLKSIFDRSAVLFGFRKDPFNTFNWIINSVKNSKSSLTVFFLLGASKIFEESLNSQKESFKLLIKNVSDYQEIGLIFSDEALNSLAILNEEKEKIEAITNRTLRRSMNNEYLVSLPHNYRNLIELEIATDYTMVYENVIGFRASTCCPFLFYDLDYEIVTPLKIHPISLTSKSLNKIPASKKTETIQKMMQSVNKVNGVFSMIFDNYNFMNSKKNTVLKTIFSEINK